MSVVYFTDRDLGRQFPAILRDAGLAVERHTDHFPDDCGDVTWLRETAARGWVAITHDARIRYKPNELEAVVASKARLLVVVGKAPYADLARSFLATSRRIERFVAATPAPFIAKVYRSSAPAAGRTQKPVAGRVELWFPPPEDS